MWSLFPMVSKRLCAFSRSLAQLVRTSTDKAVKDHWNPADIVRRYHPYKFPVRTKDEFQRRYKYRGYSYAGVAQFPWLVEIRGIDSEDYEQQEEWSNGNLVSSRYVLTVCPAVADFVEYEKTPIWGEHDILVGIPFDLKFVSPKDPRKFKVLYSDDYTYKTVGNGYYTGTRYIKRFIIHPRCNMLELDFQWALVEVKRSIWPAPPWTGFMPLDFNVQAYNQMKKNYINNERNVEKSARCVVGLWSRKLYGIQSAPGIIKGDPVTTKIYDSEYLLNYKIKYFVVPTRPGDCWYNSTRSYPPRFSLGETIEEWECMALNSNETLGAVCDRDRGAPIVCDGVVRAVVLTGAREDQCNMTRPLPFLVMDIKFALDIFTEVSNREWLNKDLRNYLRLKPRKDYGLQDFKWYDIQSP